MNRYLNGASAGKKALHLLDEATALGDNPEFSCPRPIPPEIRSVLVVVSLTYFSLDGGTHIGQLVVHRELVWDVRTVFAELLRRRFPIRSIVPIAAYGWDDDRSMAADNTSAFNYRPIAGKKELSLHAYGRAIDINPWRNPCRTRCRWQPSGARYDPTVPGTITADSFVVVLFRRHGFLWGGNWQEPFDPQHFYKP